MPKNFTQMKKYFSLQVTVIAAGTAYAWGAVFADFSRFFQAGGDWWQFSGCRFPNPLATPCFYGAVVFGFALAWAVYLWQSQNPVSQKNLSRLLLAGTLFAWSVTAWEFYKFLRPHVGAYIGCNGLAAENPIHTPCFTGASLYLAAWLVSLWIIKRLAKAVK